MYYHLESLSKERQVLHYIVLHCLSVYFWNICSSAFFSFSFFFTTSKLRDFQLLFRNLMGRLPT